LKTTPRQDFKKQPQHSETFVMVEVGPDGKAKDQDPGGPLAPAL